MELRGTDADIEPILKPGEVGGLAGGAEILQVLCLVLHPLKYPILPGGAVLVVHWLQGVGVWLLEGADLTLGRPGAGHGGWHPVVPDTNQSTTLSTH